MRARDGACNTRIPVRSVRGAHRARRRRLTPWMMEAINQTERRQRVVGESVLHRTCAAIGLDMTAISCVFTMVYEPA